METKADQQTVDEQLSAHEPSVETRESLRRVLDISPGALVIADRHGIITNANRAAKDILGVAPETLIGRKVDEIPITLVSPDETQVSSPILRPLKDEQDIVNEDLGIVTPLGELKYILLSAVPLRDEHGCLAGAIYSFVDITERKRSQKALEESERRLRLMLDNMNDIVFLLDTQSNVIYVSPSIEKHTGWTPDELINMGQMTSSLPQFIHPDDIAKIQSVWEQTLQGKTQGDIEFRGLTKDGRVLWFSASWSPVLDEEGRFIAVQGSVRDVTERVLAEEAKQQTEQEKRNFYRVTIAAFTGGKLEIVDHEVTSTMISEPEVTVLITTPEDASTARDEAMQALLRHGIAEDKAKRFTLAVGEAITNAIRHGLGGEVRIGYNGEEVWVAIIDHGPGIETLAIPRVTLERGYSGKISLGMGYSMMLDMADRIWLSTSQEGTTVVMTCCAENHTKNQQLDSLPDTW